MTERLALAQRIADDKAKGHSYITIGQNYGIDPLDARQMVREVIESTSIDDEWEMRGIALLRLEKVVENLWKGLENGSFKHAEVLVRAIDQTSTLLALNKQVMKDRQMELTDQQAELIFSVLTLNNQRILEYIQDTLKPNKRQLQQLEA